MGLSRETADRVLQMRRRHVALLEQMPVPSEAFTGTVLRRTYKSESERTRQLTEKAKIPRDRLETIAEALREPLKDKYFRSLLSEEVVGSIPQTLIDRITRQQPEPATSATTEAALDRLVGGICPEALDLLEDWYVPPHVFASLRKMVPARQLVATKLMIALGRVRFNYANLLSALTPNSKLANPSEPRKKFVGVADDQLAAMETELGALNEEFLYCAESHGTWSLELVAAMNYLDRLMENARVVRYLAQNFPGQLAEFQNISEPKQRR